MNGDAAPIFSRLASTQVSAARPASVRFMAASSGSPVVSPASWCTPVTPTRNRSAVTSPAASTAAAPQVTAECLSSRPPSTKTSTVGCSTSAAATVGLWVTTVADRSRGRAAVTARAVVPPSSSSVLPGRTSPAAAAATRDLLSSATEPRVA